MNPAADYFSSIDYLMIEANSSCNLACRYCNRKQLEENGLREKKNLSREEFQKFLNQFKSLKPKQIKFEGLSEPMLHKEFDLLSSDLRSYFPDAFIIIATNLQYKLSQTPFVKTLPFVDMVYLSIDGIEGIYEQSRSGARYSKLLDSLNEIRQLVSTEVRKKKLHINFTASPLNYKELPKIYDLQKEYDLAGVRINLAQNWSQNSSNHLLFPEEMIQFLKTYKEDMKGVADWDFNKCFWPFNGLIVDVFGDVRQCVIKTDTEPHGNIWKTDIKKLYNESMSFKEARQKLHHNEAPDSCQNCEYKNLSPILKRILGEQPGTPSFPKVVK